MNNKKSPSRRRELSVADILIVPGRGGSGHDHWQSHFERRYPNAQRVQQNGWDNPDLESWATRIADTGRSADSPQLVIAHSFGCLAAVYAVLQCKASTDALLLVAPADPERFGIPDEWIRHPLPVPSLLVGSDTDPWLDAGRARTLANVWGSHFLCLGDAGHINVASGFGAWPDCEELAAALLQRVPGYAAHHGAVPRRAPRLSRGASVLA